MKIYLTVFKCLHSLVPCQIPDHFITYLYTTQNVIDHHHLDVTHFFYLSLDEVLNLLALHFVTPSLNKTTANNLTQFTIYIFLSLFEKLRVLGLFKEQFSI